MDAPKDPEHAGTVIAAVSGALLAVLKADAILGFLGRRWSNFVAWYQRPSQSEMFATALRENTQEIRGIRVELTSINVSFQNATELALISASISRIALNETQVPRWETDENGQCVWCNEALCRLFNLPFSEMLGTKWTQAIAPGHAAGVARSFQEAYAHPDDYEYVHPYPIIVHGKLINIVARAVEVLKKKDKDGHTKVLRMFGRCDPVETIAA